MQGLPLMRLAKDAAKALAGKMGYEIRPNDLRYGEDVFRDVLKISADKGLSIRSAFDVGANKGQTSTKMLQFFPQADVYAFEPHPAAFKGLTKNITINRFHPF